MLLAITALVGGCASPSPTPSPVPAPSSTAAPGTSPALPTPTPDPAAWSAVEVSALPPVATLEPTKQGAAGVAVDTAFRLTSLDGRSPSVLAAAIVAEPSISFRVETADASTAVLRPMSPLRPRTSYRLAIVRPDGTVEAAWAATAAGPLSITDTVPGDTATRVPRDTGIEITFDQYGVRTADLARSFSIEPAVEGSFKASGRTIAFVPDRPLAKGRLYTVTVRHGLPLAGTGQVLETDHTFRFETRSSSAYRLVASFRRAVVDGNRREPTAITVDFDWPDEDWGKRPSSLPVTIHRLSGLRAGRAAYDAIRSAPEWTLASTVAPVSTKGLDRVFTGDLRVRRAYDIRWILAPRLPNGWYVLTERWNGIPRQVVLQITDLATFALVEQDRSAIWVNDIGTGLGAEGATVSLDSRRLGSTDARGLLQAETPATVLERSDEDLGMLIVRHAGRAAFLPVTSRWWNDSLGWGGGLDDWWRTFATDRYDYRTTDTVNAWGIVRGRDSGTVPASVRVTLLSEDSDDEQRPIAAVTATPDTNGAFTAAVPIDDLPLGGYRIVLAAGDDVLSETWIRIGTIVKPSYQLEVTTDRHALILGESLTESVRATFFEGTPVAGVDLTLWGGQGSAAAVRTDEAGAASGVVRMGADDEDEDDGEQWTIRDVGARPTLPEEAEISGGTPVAVFAASAVVDATGSLDGTRLTLRGAVHDVAFDRYEEPGADPWQVDPRGDARPGANVRLTVVEETQTRRQTGTRYDFITKRTVPEYDYGTSRKTVLERTVTTGADGTFRLAIDVRGGSRTYVVTGAWTDEAGRTTTARDWMGDGRGAEDEGMWLARVDDGDPDGYRVGDTIRVRVRGGGGHTADSRYLYAISQRGLHYATVGTSPTFRTTFEADDVPQVTISGVRFNGTGYETAIGGYVAQFLASDRSLQVELTPDRARYAPGDTATVGVRTLDAAGSPVPASVVVRAIDEKLFAMGDAEQVDTLSYLYESVGSGIESWAASHATPWEDIGWGKGDTTGGGGNEGRIEFRDWLVASIVRTGADGRGSVTVPLSDDLTSWRVIGSGVDQELRAGDGSTQLPVGLPFFVEATIAPEYLVSDRPVIRVRGFGDGLVTGSSVTFTVSSTTLPMEARTVTAPAFTAAEIALPALSAGMHRIRIEAVTGTGATQRTDTLTRSFRVVATRATQARTTWAVLDGTTRVADGAGFTSLILAEAGRGRVLPVLESLQASTSLRSDDVLAAGLAARVLDEQFGLSGTRPLDPEALGAYEREDSGLALLPYSSFQLEVTALAAMSGDPRLDLDAIRSTLWDIRYNGENRRDRRITALAGLAALEPSVLPDVRTVAKRVDLTVAERISLALAALNAGDEALARELEADILRTSGKRLGGWVRIDAGPDADDSLETARLAIVAASLGDPLAADMDRWLEVNPSEATSLALERALAARGWATRVPGAAAVAALTVDDSRSEIRIEPGRPVRVPLTPAQARDAVLEPVSGSVLVVQGWETALEPSSLAPASGQQLERLVSPTGAVGPADTVVVTLRVTLGPDAGDSCWRLVDLVPSGLAPIQGPRWNEEGEEDSDGASPGSVDGQRVEFCASHAPDQLVQSYRYVARVVTPGTYTWEPTVLQSTIAPEQGVVLPARSLTITGLGS